MHMVSLPTKEDVRMPEADPKFRGETWQTATEAQARLALTRLPLALTHETLKPTHLVPKFRGEAWQTATDAQACRALTRLPPASAGAILRIVVLIGNES